MANEHNVQQVWSGMVEAERHQRYYDRLQGRLIRYHIILMATIGTGSASAALSLFIPLPDIFTAALYFVVTAAVMATLLADFSRKSAVASAISSQYADLAGEWKRLWRRLDDMDPREVLGKTDGLERAHAIIGRNAGECGATDHALNERATREAGEVLHAEFS